MKKVTLVAVLVLAFVSTVFGQASECVEQDFDCIEVGDSCDIDEQICATDDEKCTVCEGSGGCRDSKCAANYIGKACSTRSDCYGFLDSTPADCIMGVCEEVSENYLYAGDSCSGNQCATLNCTNGICAGHSQGEPCTSDLDCDWNLFCDGGFCDVYREQGEICAAHCNFDVVCNTDTDECAERYVVEEDGTCGVTAQCEDDYVCAGKECVDKEDGEETCDPDAVPDPCFAKYGGQSRCSCDGDQGEYRCTASGTPNQCIDDITAFDDCVKANECRRETSSSFFFAGGCVYENCFEEYTQRTGCENVDSEGFLCALGISSGSALTNFIRLFF